MHKERKDLTNKSFGQLIAIDYSCSGKAGVGGKWRCLCSCGNYTHVSVQNLEKGHTKSCGCLAKKLSSERLTKRLTTHGMFRTPIYKTWERIKARCNNPNAVGYKNYGGRGIKLCARWNEFENFFADMGERPKGLSIERKDNDKGYSPENCKWVTQKEQCRNKRNNRIIKGKSIAEWSEILNLPYNILYYRISSGWDWEKIKNTHHHPPLNLNKSRK